MSTTDLGMTERRFYQINKRREAPYVQYWGVKKHERPGARGGFLMAGQDYSVSDYADVLAWLADRAAGYAESDARFRGALR